MSSATISTGTSKSSSVDVTLLRNALRLVHCIQKERGSSCAYYADSKIFESAMLEARTASDVSARLIRHKDWPVASSLCKIRNLIAIHKNPQDSTDDDFVMHRIFICFNTLISSVVHECILKQVFLVANSQCKTTIRNRRKRGLSSDINDKLFGTLFMGESPDVASSHKTEPSPSSPKISRKPRVLMTVESCDWEDDEAKNDGSTAPPPPPPPPNPSAAPSTIPEHEDPDNSSSNLSSSPHTFQMLSATRRKISFGKEPPPPKDHVQQLLDLLHIFVQLKESAGIERAIVSSLLAFRTHKDTLRMLINDLILEVENQRSLVNQLEQLPNGSHRNLVLELAQLSPRLKELQTIILTDFESLQTLQTAEYDSESIFYMITLYVDKLHSVELLIMEELECSLPEPIPKIPKSSSSDALSALLIPPQNTQPRQEQQQQQQPIAAATCPVSPNYPSRALLEQMFSPSNGFDLVSHIESMSAEDLKKRVLEVIKAEAGSTLTSEAALSSSFDNCDPHSSAAESLNEDMNRALHKPLNKRSSKEWEISIYEIQFTKRIGQGASATTYLATWTGQNVAVKVASITKFGLEGWRTEVDALQRLHHPNIIRLLGSIYHENPLTYCLVLEYCNAGDLASALRYPTPRNFFFHVAVSISTAMTYLHSRHVIHRDLKPGNVLCDGNIASGNFTVKVTDFGVAAEDFGATAEAGGIGESLSGGGGGGGRNLTGETGTYRWMAPEVVRHEAYSNKADVYSFAIMMWQFLTHEEPFLDVSSTEAARLVALERKRPPLPKKTPKALEDFIQTNWSDQPRERWDFEKVTATLKQIQENSITAEEKTWLEASYGHPVYQDDDDDVLEEEIAKQKLLQQKAGQQKAGRRQSSKLKVPDLKVPFSDNGPKKAGSLLSNFFGVNKKTEKKQ